MDCDGSVGYPRRMDSRQSVNKKPLSKRGFLFIYVQSTIYTKTALLLEIEETAL